MRCILTGIFLFIGAVLLLGTGAWGTFALYFDGPENDVLCAMLASAYGVAALAALGAYCAGRLRWIAVTSYTSMFIVLVGWWSMIEPSNDREWQPEVAVLPYATFEGDLVTVHNIRNFDYRTETDFTPHYDDRTYDLTKLDAVDLIAVYWMGPEIAHIFLSFGFGDSIWPFPLKPAKKPRRDILLLKVFLSSTN